jgi:hypothetical protein
VRISSCVACQHGNHDQHQRVIQAVPAGLLGGVVCGCKGECQGKPEPHIQREVNLIRGALAKARPS